MENFNIKRFCSYLVSDAKMVWSNCWISLLVMTSMPLIQYVFNGLFRVLFGEHWEGQSYPGRFIIFIIMLICVCLVFPAKTYGRVTDKRSGSEFTLLPVSSFEKTLSMLLNSCIAIPAIFLCGYALMDYIICAADTSCGIPIFKFSAIKESIIGNITVEELQNLFSAAMNPVLYIDDVIMVILIFLLGAICFKKGKVSKTILCYIIISMFFSLTFTPIFKDVIGSMSINSENIHLLIDRFEFLFSHPVLVDTLNDTIINVALCVAIFFRVKTIKF